MVFRGYTKRGRHKGRDFLQPLRIRLALVRPSGTLTALTAMLPFERHTHVWFRVLNGLEPGDKLQPGQPVKLVSP